MTCTRPRTRVIIFRNENDGRARPGYRRAVERLRREHGRGLSEAINELIRRGLSNAIEAQPFVPRSQPLGLRIDVSDVANALEIHEGTDAR